MEPPGIPGRFIDLLVNHFEYALAQATKIELFPTMEGEDAAQQGVGREAGYGARLPM